MIQFGFPVGPTLDLRTRAGDGANLFFFLLRGPSRAGCVAVSMRPFLVGDCSPALPWFWSLLRVRVRQKPAGGKGDSTETSDASRNAGSDPTPSGGSTGNASGVVPTTGLPGAGGVMPCTFSSGMLFGVADSLCHTCDAVSFVRSFHSLLSLAPFYWSISQLPGLLRRRVRGGWRTAGLAGVEACFSEHLAADGLGSLHVRMVRTILSGQARRLAWRHESGPSGDDGCC